MKPVYKNIKNLHINIIVLLTFITFSTSLCEVDKWGVIIDRIKNDEISEARESLSSIILSSMGDDLLIASEMLASTYKYKDLPVEDLIGILNIIIRKYEVYHYRENRSELIRLEKRFGGASRAISEIAKVYYGIGDYETALKIYEKLYKELPDDENAVWFLYNSLIIRRILGDEGDDIKSIIIDRFPGSIPAKILAREKN